MNPLFGIGAGWSIVAWYVLPTRLVLPALARADPDDRLAVLLSPAMFRHVGILLLLPGVAATTMPPELARSIVVGDVITAVLAVAAVVGSQGRRTRCACPGLGLQRHRLGRPG